MYIVNIRYDTISMAFEQTTDFQKKIHQPMVLALITMRFYTHISIPFPIFNFSSNRAL